jgi:hypothetical protein
MFFSNIFSFKSRQFICERGYEGTRRELLARFDELAPILASHGYTLRGDVLVDESCTLWHSAGVEPNRPRMALGVTKALDQALERADAAR